MEAEAKASGGFIRSTETDVLIASMSKGLQRQRMQVASQLWAANIAVSLLAMNQTCKSAGAGVFTIFSMLAPSPWLNKASAVCRSDLLRWLNLSQW